ncbi:MAG: metallophosphoesterase family protein [Syntrophales bacterium]
MEKIFAIGDIHGCISYLRDLIALLDIDEEQDRIVFIGDYIDRGPDPCEVVDLILELKSKYRVSCLIGNHEQMFLDYHCHNSNRELYFLNGGTTTIGCYGIIDTPGGKKINVPEDHMEFYRSLLPYYETEEYIFVHAGMRPGIPLEKQSMVDLTWIRGEFIYSKYDFGKRVVFGHTHFSKPYIDPYKIGIDTGAVYGGRLTCLELPAIKFYQTP